MPARRSLNIALEMGERSPSKEERAPPRLGMEWLVLVRG